MMGATSKASRLSTTIMRALPLLGPQGRLPCAYGGIRDLLLALRLDSAIAAGEGLVSLDNAAVRAERRKLATAHSLASAAHQKPRRAVRHLKHAMKLVDTDALPLFRIAVCPECPIFCECHGTLDPWDGRSLLEISLIYHIYMCTLYRVSECPVNL